ncbi:energy transducer TonB [Sphingomicrobium sediminis]|uniref:Energy transducer TonB n=1 Tax=Sphingomicrobium sediminis TaxID=2950949 RepID=A0A9X2EDZ1_9SPHN|nr:energy transducer TonB [Sphingomicrobium sediminis]MCM8556273.1 energy transducer TonB [Sphingomicrobium sediminis]
MLTILLAAYLAQPAPPPAKPLQVPNPSPYDFVGMPVPEDATNVFDEAALDDDTIWSLAKDLDVVRGYDLYLALMPSGDHVEEAEDAIRRLDPLRLRISEDEQAACDAATAPMATDEAANAYRSAFQWDSKDRMEAATLDFPHHDCTKVARTLLAERDRRVRLTYSLAGFGPMPHKLLSSPIFIRDGDYPARALRAELTGRVTISWTVGTTGRVNNCEIHESSGSSILDEASCRLAERRLRYIPARNEAGETIESRGWTSILFQIP